MENLTLLLVEDDIDTCKRFTEYIDTKNDIVLLNATNSASQALSDISYYQPDAIILDLELHYGSGNGFDVLSGLRNSSTHPYILVTTNNSSDTTYECARQLGADFILYKHQQHYSEKSTIDFLYSIKNIIKRKHIQNTVDHHDTPEQRNKRINRLICEELNAIGINPKAIGYQYLIEAIYIIIDNPCPNLCAIIAQKYKKSEPSVERAMQNAINKTWTSSDIEVLLTNYTARITSDKGCPTLTEFIYYYANKIKNKL